MHFEFFFQTFLYSSYFPLKLNYRLFFNALFYIFSQHFINISFPLAVKAVGTSGLAA